ALNSMLEVACYNYQSCNSPDRKDYRFILISGGIGIEKTQIGWESKHLSSLLLTRSSNTIEFVEALKDPCYVFIDLNNESKYIRDFDNKETPNNKQHFWLSNVICKILQRHFKMQQHSVDIIIIHLDEYQIYINDIDSIMYSNNIKDEHDKKYFIVLICTRISAIDVHFLSTEHTQEMFELKPLNYISAKSMFLDKYNYSKQTTDEGRNLMMQGLKLHHSFDLNNKKVKKLSADFCNFILNQQHFRIAMYDTGFIPKFIDDLLSPSILMSNNLGDWKELNDIHTQNFDLLYGHFQKALIDNLIYVQESRINSVVYEIDKLQLQLEKQKDINKQIKIIRKIDLRKEELDHQKSSNWKLSDIFRGALGVNTLLQRKNKKFLVKTDDVASFDKLVLCDDNILNSANNRKKLAIFLQIKYSERGITTRISTPDIKDWYDITMKSVENYKNNYYVVLVLFTNQKCTGKINIETMSHLLLIYLKNLEKYLSPTFAHRGLVNRPSENDY
ncbi:24608_t:CDS:2, partial [Dentiscutata erythropus]